MHRDDFVKFINEREFKKVVELGVACGQYSSVLATSRLEELVLIDKWNDHHDDNERRLVAHKFAQDYRVRIIHGLFAEAVQKFKDGYFDFVYIDGYAHTGQDSGQTIRQWWPKVAPGGFFGGHDYHPNWPLTMQEVQSFCQELGLTFCTTEEAYYPSWYLFKPTGNI